MSSDYTLYWLYYKTLRHLLGYQGNLTWRNEKFKWRAKNGWPIKCSVCNRNVKRPRKGGGYKSDQMTIDHIIPHALLKELELYELLYDHDNMALMCERCNVNKADNKLDTDDLSPNLRVKFYAALDRRNAEL